MSEIKLVLTAEEWRAALRQLRGAIKRLEAEPEPYNLGREVELRSLADRIEALLPKTP